MNINRVRYGRLATAVFLATFFAMSPPARAGLADGQEVEIRVIQTTMMPGGEVPDVIPESLRPAVAAKATGALPGSTLVVIDPSAAVGAPNRVAHALNSFTRDPNPDFWPLLFIIVIIVVVVTVILATLINAAQHIPPPVTNDESVWTNGYSITSLHRDPQPNCWLTNMADCAGVVLEGCTNLAEGVWFELCTMRLEPVWASMIQPGMDFCAVSIHDPNGGLLGEAICSGDRSEAEVLTQRSPPVHVPAPVSPLMYFRTRSL
jgi:hypothetical protein